MILVVDDHRDSREFLATLLKRQGFVVRTASSGKDALEMAQQQPAKVFILDENMPEMSGLELFERMKELGLLDNAKVIFLSGTFEQKIAKQALDAGAMEWLVKGVHGPKHIMAAVARAVMPA
jgi:two-component system alkaline phosphatase synthesis response regulator PhoP